MMKSEYNLSISTYSAVKFMHIVYRFHTFFYHIMYNVVIHLQLTTVYDQYMHRWHIQVSGLSIYIAYFYGPRVPERERFCAPTQTVKDGQRGERDGDGYSDKHRERERERERERPRNRKSFFLHFFPIKVPHVSWARVCCA